MSEWLVMSALSFVVLLVVIGGMSIGVINGRRPIRGSCGGLGGGACELCSGGPCRKRRPGGEQ